MACLLVEACRLLALVLDTLIEPVKTRSSDADLSVLVIEVQQELPKAVLGGGREAMTSTTI
jgi:hypothetical protein